MACDDLPYVNLEEPDVRDFAATDPRAFLAPFSAYAELPDRWADASSTRSCTGASIRASMIEA